MRKLLTSISALLIAGSALAQTAAPAQQTTTGSRAQVPNEITRDVIGDWQIKCFVGGEQEQCFLFQLVVGNNNQPLLEYNLIPVKDESGEGVVLGATMIAPLNVILTRGILQVIDDGTPIQRPYGWCAPVGCYARFGLTQEQIDAYAAGTTLRNVIFSVQNPNSEIPIDVSLNGFSDAYAKLLTYEEANKAAAPAE